jgi:hypothetical protein
MAVVMGISGFLNKRAHQEYFKRGMELSWTALHGFGTVFGPLSLLMQSNQPTREEAVRRINRWLTAWTYSFEKTRNNLMSSGDEYGVWAGYEIQGVLPRV